MKNANDGIRSQIRVGYDGRVHKTYCGKDKNERYENEIEVLQELESRGCDFVPRLLESDEDSLSIITTGCGSFVQNLSDKKTESLFTDLKEEFGILHNDPTPQNVTYDAHQGRFCVINFESAEILGSPVEKKPVSSFNWYGVTKSGSRKEENEDSLSVFTNLHGWPNPEPLAGTRKADSGSLIFAVSDGMGGHAGGAVASHMVISELQHYLPTRLGDEESIGTPPELMENAILSLHEHVLRTAEGRPDVDDMGATVVCGLFDHEELHFGHVGDSRLYRFRDGRLSQITDDHSFVGKLQLDGKISEREARINPRRNILTQAIGAQCLYIHPQVGSVQVRPGDWYLICSDGIVDGLWDKHIEQEFLMAGLTHNTPKGVAINLLERSYREAGRDDTTLFVVKAE